ncbi:hypothetical protein QAD02_019834 [Eretmocerus hayati]|uniref:Uncharacterized protein n=1 Tax=Eretmocerus hayati TaxID=131215 RepID=A0ACC2PNY6_9HYME|nr:hypothetical protein QAD02_019834 [Eretmocerus hayati]
MTQTQDLQHTELTKKLRRETRGKEMNVKARISYFSCMASPPFFAAALQLMTASPWAVVAVVEAEGIRNCRLAQPYGDCDEYTLVRGWKHEICHSCDDTYTPCRATRESLRKCSPGAKGKLIARVRRPSSTLG